MKASTILAVLASAVLSNASPVAGGYESAPPVSSYGADKLPPPTSYQPQGYPGWAPPPNWTPPPTWTPPKPDSDPKEASGDCSASTANSCCDSESQGSALLGNLLGGNCSPLLGLGGGECSTGNQACCPTTTSGNNNFNLINIGSVCQLVAL